MAAQEVASILAQAWRVPIELPAGGTCEIVFLLGEGSDRGAAERLIESYREPGRVDDAFETVTRFSPIRSRPSKSKRRIAKSI